MKLFITTFMGLFFSLLLAAQNPPIISCTSDTTGNNVAVRWINNHNCATVFTATNIYRSDNSTGPFTEVGSVMDPTATLYVDQAAGGFIGELFYYVEHDCSGTTAASDTISSLDPTPPTILSVSVVDDAVEINWEPGNFPESFGTKIFRFINGGPATIQDVVPHSTAQAIDLTATPSDQIERYDLSTIDGCGNSGAFTGASHQTIFLFQGDDPCNGLLTFSWSSYIGWDNVLEYRLLKNGQSIEAINTSPLSTSYSITEDDSAITCFLVEAENDGGITSRSNEICFDFSQPIDCFTGINDVANEALLLFPNPVQSILHIENVNFELEHLEIISLEGKTVLERAAFSTERTAIDVAHLATGMYIVKALGAERHFTGRFAKVD